MAKHHLLQSGAAHVQGDPVDTHVAVLLLSFSIETLHGSQDM